MDGSVGWTIVAVPDKDDYVWNLSSEKIPHMTLLFLGDKGTPEMESRITEFLQHVADTSMHKFGLSVDNRGSLGPNEADVLFFDKGFAKSIVGIRSMMIQNDDIQQLYNSVEQYPEWTPHLTLGYPEAPAKKDTREYPGTSWVNFDTLAFWTGDFTGVDFPLPVNEENGIGMSDLDTVLAHHGVKGMKWGVRRSREQLSTARKTKASDKALPLSKDAMRAKTNRRIAKNGGVGKLSNEELQSLVTRMNLEQQYSRLVPPTGSAKAKKFVSDIVLNVGKQQAQKYANDQVGEYIKKKSAK